MTGYKVMKQTRTDGQSDQYSVYTTMCRVPDNLLHVFLALLHPLEVITSF